MVPGVGAAEAPPSERFGVTLSAEHLDIAAAVAGHGVAIGSPILFPAETEAAKTLLRDVVTIEP